MVEMCFLPDPVSSPQTSPGCLVLPAADGLQVISGLVDEVDQWEWNVVIRNGHRVEVTVRSLNGGKGLSVECFTGHCSSVAVLLQ